MRSLSGQKVGELFQRITERLIEESLTISAMESCTGGLIASLLTDTEGASATISRSWVTYSNEAKIAEGVPAEVIANHGVYSRSTAEAMAATARARSGSDYAIGITGTLGRQDPANGDSVSGEVFVAIANQNGITSDKIEVGACDTRQQAKYQVAEQIAIWLYHILTTAGQEENP